MFRTLFFQSKSDRKQVCLNTNFMNKKKFLKKLTFAHIFFQIRIQNAPKKVSSGRFCRRHRKPDDKPIGHNPEINPERGQHSTLLVLVESSLTEQHQWFVEFPDFIFVTNKFRCVSCDEFSILFNRQETPKKGYSAQFAKYQRSNYRNIRQGLGNGRSFTIHFFKLIEECGYSSC